MSSLSASTASERSSLDDSHLVDSGYDVKWLENLVEKHDAFVAAHASTREETQPWSVLKNLIFTYRTSSLQLHREMQNLHDDLIVARETRKNLESILSYVYTETHTFLEHCDDK